VIFLGIDWSEQHHDVEVQDRECATNVGGEANVEDRVAKDDVVQEMEVGPPEPSCRGRLQTTVSCAGQIPGRGGERCGKGAPGARQV